MVDITADHIVRHLERCGYVGAGGPPSALR